MRRLAIAAFMIGLLPLAAYAQNEKAYQDAIRRLKASSAPAAPVDPWQSVRPAPATSDVSKK